MRITELTDTLGNTYYGLKFNKLYSENINNYNDLELKNLYLKFMEVCSDYVTYENNRISRDKDSSHMTILSVADLNYLYKIYGVENYINIIDSIKTVNITDLKFKGLGSGSDDKDNETFFIVCESEILNNMLNYLKLKPKALHITLGFNKKDLFTIDKSIVKY